MVEGGSTERCALSPNTRTNPRSLRLRSGRGMTPRQCGSAPKRRASREPSTVQAAAKSLGLQLSMFNASTPSEIDAAFNAIAEKRPDSLLVGTDSFLLSRREQIVAWAARLRIPAIYPFRDF